MFRPARSVVYAVALVLTPLVASRTEAGWTRLSGPVPPQTSVLLEHAGYCFLGSNFADSGDLFRSSDGGHTWADVRLPNGGVSAMYAHGANLYLGAYLSGGYRSTDDGTSWEHLGGPLASGTPTAFLALDADTLLASRGDFFGSALARSTDGGATWEEIPGGPSLNALDLAAVPGAVLVASDDQGVLRSTDGGATWTPANTGLPGNVSAQRFAVDGSVAWVAAKALASPLAVHRSTDAGASWTQVSVDLPITQTAGRFFADGGRLYLATTATSGEAGLYRSADDGAHWEKLGAALPGGMSVSTAAFLDGDLVVGKMEGAFRSTDDGATWSPSWHGSSGVFGSLAVAPAFGELFAGSDLLGTSDEGVLHTPDYGGSWTASTGTGTNSTARDFLVSDGRLFAALYGLQRGVHVSTDAGATFEPSGSWASGVVLNALHEHDGVLLAGAFERHFRSTDGGQSWSEHGDIGTVYDFASHDGWLWAARYPGGVARSSDAGLTWTNLDAGLPGGPHINALAVFDGAVYAAVNVGPVVRWDGSQWVESGLDGEFPYALASADGALVAGTAFSEVWYTTDGSTWTDWSADFTGGIVEAMTVTPERVVVGTRGKGVWTRPLGELPGATSVGPEVPGSALRIAAAPNPFADRTAVRFDLRRAGPVTARVFDVTGRQVRALEAGALPAGPHRIPWDGRDDAGRAVTGGVYFLRVASPDGDSTVRVTRLR